MTPPPSRKPGSTGTKLPTLTFSASTFQVEDGNILNISGERTKLEESNTDTWHRAERRYGSFLRRFKLPENANMDDVRCDLDHGVLTVTVPKKEVKKLEGNIRDVNIRDVNNAG